MIALPQRLPHVIWKNDRLVPLSEGWLAESIEHSAEAAGHHRWHLAPEVARAIAIYLENDWIAPALPVDHLIYRSLNRLPADGTLLAGFIDTRHQLFAIKRLVTSISLQNPEIVALDFLIRREPMFARETLPPPTYHRLIFNGARIDHLIITSLTFWATHLPVVV